MATCIWVGNSINSAQIDTGTCTGATTSATLSATINGKAITYTMTGTDTNTTAVSGLLTLLQASAVPPEFTEITWTSSGAVLTATDAVPGRGFTLTLGSSGGATFTQAHPQANVSQNDPGNAANWNRAGSAAIPVNGDNVVCKDSSVPISCNLTALSGVQFASFTRWQSQTGAIGLPEINPLGYVEYRPTYFKFIGNASPITILLGEGSGSGPPRERYDLGSQQVVLTVLGSGQAADAFAVRFLGTNASNTFTVINTSLGIASTSGEVSTIASGVADGGGSITLGPGVTFSGALTVSQSTATVYVAPASIMASNGSNVTVGGAGLTYAVITGTLGTTFTWLSDSTITTLLLQTNSVLDKSQDIRPMTITNSTIDGDTCIVNDPLSVITWTTATSVHGNVTSGPMQFLGTRTLKLG